MPHSAAAICGHSGCGPSCNVRYSGPTSHPRDHLIHQAAHGARHVWMASVVAGLAVVLTGAMAYTAVQAESAPRVKNLNEAVSALWKKMDSIEKMVKQINERLPAKLNTGSPTSTQPTQNKDGQNGTTKPVLSDEAKACITACQTTWKSCQTSAADDKSAKEACTKTGQECLKACVPSGAPVPPLTTGGSQGGTPPQPTSVPPGGSDQNANLPQ